MRKMNFSVVKQFKKNKMEEIDFVRSSLDLYT